MIPFAGPAKLPRIPVEEFEVTYVRSSGPGGQNVNKVNSKCVLKWNVHASHGLSQEAKARFMHAFANRINSEGLLVLSSDTYRDQKRNYQDCIEKLQAMIVKIARPPKPRKPSQPTAGSKRRRERAKSARAQVKQLRGKVRDKD